jgi:hypothetical protein
MLGELSQLSERAGRIVLDDVPLDLVIRCFSVNQIIDDAAGQAAYDLMCRACERNSLVLYTPLETFLFNDKGTIALLSDAQFGDRFSRDERQLIDRLIPWTRTLRERRTEFNGEPVDLISFCLEFQDDLVLKPSAGYGGIGVVTGWETGKEEWADLLRRNVGGPFVVQSRVTPAAEPVVNPDTGAVEEVVVTWGIYMSDTGYAGAVMRAAPLGGGGVINFGTHASVTGLFTYPERHA